MRSGERVRMTLCRAICWGVDHLPVSFIPWRWISWVTAVVWMLDIAQVIVFWLFGSGVVAVVDGDMVVVLGGLDCKRRVCGVSRGAVDRLGAVCHHF